MAKVDFLPKPDEQFRVWLTPLLTYIQNKQTVWSIPEEPVTELQALSAAFGDALSAAENPLTRTKVTVQKKNDARKAVESKLRPFLKAYVTYNPAVTNADRDAMGLPVHKTTRTDVPVPKTTVEAEVFWPSPGVVEIRYRDSESKHRGKPDGVHGAEVAWAILASPPVNWTDLDRSTFDTRSPLRLTFEGKERGKTLYFAIRWENTRGEKGPWGEIMMALIP
jgi:hypothetical protein